MVAAECGDDLEEVVLRGGGVIGCGELVDDGGGGITTNEAAHPAQRGERQVADSRVEKRPHLAAQLESGEFAEKIAKYLLHHVLREVLTAADPAGHAENPIAVAVVEDFKRLVVALIDAIDQQAVIGLTGRMDWVQSGAGDMIGTIWSLDNS